MKDVAIINQLLEEKNIMYEKCVKLNKELYYHNYLLYNTFLHFFTIETKYDWRWVIEKEENFQTFFNQKSHFFLARTIPKYQNMLQYRLTNFDSLAYVLQNEFKFGKIHRHLDIIQDTKVTCQNCHYEFIYQTINIPSLCLYCIVTLVIEIYQLQKQDEQKIIYILQHGLSLNKLSFKVLTNYQCKKCHKENIAASSCIPIICSGCAENIASLIIKFFY